MFDLIGKTVGPYRILEQAGAGGMATVYKAYQPNMDRYIAVKVLPVHLSNDPEFAKRFQREARAIARLEHAHILPVYDYGEYEGITYIAMRYIKAGTLKDRMSAGRLSLDEINHLVSQIGSALDYAHRMGVIHRDIKPGNVLMDEQGDIYLSDFGLARMMEQSQQLTGSGVGLGTPAYMSPEQGQGNKIDHRTDIYALGIILYEMLTGRVPYEAETPMAVVLKHIQGDLPLPHTINTNTPEPVERVILKALAKDPADRYQTTGEMVQALNFAARMMSAEAQQDTMTDKVAPTQQDVSIVTKIQRLWDQPRGKIMLASGAIVVILLLGFLLMQLPGNITILAPRANQTNTIVTNPETQIATKESSTRSTFVPETTIAQPTTTVLETSANGFQELYDDFSTTAFDGEFNDEFWVSQASLPNTIQQQNGMLVITNETKSPEKETLFFARKILTSNQGFYVETRMQFNGQSTGEYAEVNMALRTTMKNGRGLLTGCFITRGKPFQIWCEVWGRDKAEFSTDKYITNVDTWHIVRIEVVSGMKFIYYIDGVNIGSYEPSFSEQENKDTFSFNYNLGVWTPSKDGVIGEYDYVRIGAIQSSTPSASKVPEAAAYGCAVDDKLLFAEDFENSVINNQMGLLMKVAEAPGGGHALHMVNVADGSIDYFLIDGTVIESRIRFRVMPINGAWGLRFRIGELDGIIASHGLYVNPGDTPLSLNLDMDPSYASLGRGPRLLTGEWSIVEMIREDSNTIVVWLNNEEVIRYEDSRNLLVPSGGINVNVVGKDAEVWYDDFVICGQE